MPAIAERLRRAYPALTERAGVGSIPANPDARNVPSFRRWRLEMKLNPFKNVSNPLNLLIKILVEKSKNQSASNSNFESTFA